MATSFKHIAFIAFSIFSCACVFGLPVEDMPAPTPRIPDSDGNLHIYALPVGQGDAHVIQCPSGTLSIMDWGSSDGAAAGYWFQAELTAFLAGKFHLVQNIIMSHNHFDHYSFIEEVFNVNEDLSGLENIFMSCRYEHMVASIQTWVRAIGAENKLRPFNNGNGCGANGVACEAMNLCPNDPSVVVTVMSANIGAQCTTGNKNIDSLVFNIRHGSVSVQFNGDFEDFTSTASENGPQKQMVDYYGQEMQVTVYKISHHGAENLANKKVMRDAVRPKAIFVSGNPWYGYGHPRCGISDAFKNDVMTLCKPAESNPASSLYCGEHPYPNVPMGDRVQTVYTCGTSSTSTREDVNDYAIYSTVPNASTINLIKFSSDGTRWGFTNTITPKIKREGIVQSDLDKEVRDECFV